MIIKQGGALLIPIETFSSFRGQEELKNDVSKLAVSSVLIQHGDHFFTSFLNKYFNSLPFLSNCFI